MIHHVFYLWAMIPINSYTLQNFVFQHHDIPAQNFNPYNYSHMQWMAQHFTLQQQLHIDSTINHEKLYSENFSQLFFKETNLFGWNTGSYTKQYIQQDIVVTWNKILSTAYKSLNEVCESMIDMRTDALPFDMYETLEWEQSAVENDYSKWIIDYNPIVLLYPSTAKQREPEYERSTWYDQEEHSFYKRNREKFYAHLCSVELHNYKPVVYDTVEDRLIFHRPHFTLLNTMIRNIITFGKQMDENNENMPKYNRLQFLHEKARYLMMLLENMDKLFYKTMVNGHLGMNSIVEYKQNILKQWTSFSKTIPLGLLLSPITHLNLVRENRHLEETHGFLQRKRKQEKAKQYVNGMDWDVTFITYTPTVLYWGANHVSSQITFVYDWLCSFREKIYFFVLNIVLILGSIYLLFTTVKNKLIVYKQ